MADVEIVTLKTRTGHDEEFTFDGRPYVITAKKGKKVPRTVAELAINQLAFRWDRGTGLVEEARVYIEDDLDTAQALPHEPITDEAIAEVKDTDGLGEDVILVDGRPVKKTSINFKPVKMNYAANNQE